LDRRICPEALKILDEWILKAEQENEIVWIDVLCGQASMIVGQMAELKLAEKYCYKVLSEKTEDRATAAMAHYRLAKAMFHHRRDASAREHAAKSYGLVAHPASDRDRGLWNSSCTCGLRSSTGSRKSPELKPAYSGGDSVKG
jgi:hypothetical protein